jgi:aldehyde:ferredoxin oxidoreductase
MVRCKKRVKGGPRDLDPAYGGPEYEALGALGSCCGVSDIDAVCKANELCNANSLDSISCGVTIAWAMEAFEKGLLTLEDTGGIDLHFGNGESLVKVVELIARREGIGKLLAEGTKRAAAQVGHGSEMFAVHSKGLEYPMHEPRLKRGMAIGYAISPTGADHMHSLHDTGTVGSGPDGLQAMAALRELGVLDPVPLEDMGPAKARATMYNSTLAVADNCLSMCAFLPYTMEETAAIVKAGTGWDVTSYELMKVGERALNLARVFNMREGLTAADDTLAPRSRQPTASGALSNAGIDIEELNETIHFTYEMMGWDRETGFPTAGKLEELGVGWATQHLPKK